MANSAVRERLAQDVNAWLADGLVPSDTHELLRRRYAARNFGLGQVVKSLGVAGGLFAAFGLMGLVAAIAGSKIFAGILLVAVGAALTAGGIWLSLDEMGRYSISSKTVLMLGVVMAVLGIGVVLDAMKLNSNQNVFFTGLLALVPIGILAYRFRNTFLLVLGLIAFFHWVGTWNEMWGRSTYEIWIEDPHLMCLAALGSVAVGIYHERRLQDRTGRFFQAYETMGLIYLNLSLLILSIDFGVGWGQPAVWIAILTLVSLAQIVAGARLHNPLLTSFGVTTFAVNAFTRYYEVFWNRLHTGIFFLLGGLALFGVGMGCELILRRQEESA
jgi:hypothetical protein